MILLFSKGSLLGQLAFSENYIFFFVVACMSSVAFLRKVATLCISRDREKKEHLRKPISLLFSHNPDDDADIPSTEGLSVLLSSLLLTSLPP